MSPDDGIVVILLMEKNWWILASYTCIARESWDNQTTTKYRQIITVLIITCGWNCEAYAWIIRCKNHVKYIERVLLGVLFGCLKALTVSAHINMIYEGT